VKICITVEADEALCARLVDMVERIIAARPQSPSLPHPKLEDAPPAYAVLAGAPHRFRRANGHGHV
jgi:hypothetical protein